MVHHLHQDAECIPSATQELNAMHTASRMGGISDRVTCICQLDCSWGLDKGNCTLITGSALKPLWPSPKYPTQSVSGHADIMQPQNTPRALLGGADRLFHMALRDLNILCQRRAILAIIHVTKGLLLIGRGVSKDSRPEDSKDIAQHKSFGNMCYAFNVADLQKVQSCLIETQWSAQYSLPVYCKL